MRAEAGTATARAIQPSKPDAAVIGAAHAAFSTRTIEHASRGQARYINRFGTAAALRIDFDDIEQAAASEPLDFGAWSESLGSDGCFLAWNALLDATLGLVRCVTENGWRVLIAQPRRRNPKRKSSVAVKRRILRQLLSGVSKKFIAIELGLPPSTVDFHLKGALSDLGFASRGDLLRVLTPPPQTHAGDPSIVATAIHPPLDMQGWRGTLCGEPAMILAYRPPSMPSFPQLTKTEAELACLLLAGASNQNMADQRGTSKFTVANQIASIFRKLGVHSRAELAAWAGKSR